jgi:hypothetical protein
MEIKFKTIAIYELNINNERSLFTIAEKLPYEKNSYVVKYRKAPKIITKLVNNEPM